MNYNDMKANRFGRWCEARKKLAEIIRALDSGKTVMVSTYTKATQYTAKHKSMFSASKTGLYVQHGKSWVCIDYCKITIWS